MQTGNLRSGGASACPVLFDLGHDRLPKPRTGSQQPPPNVEGQESDWRRIGSYVEIRISPLAASRQTPQYPAVHCRKEYPAECAQMRMVEGHPALAPVGYGNASEFPAMGQRAGET